jgi:hypothetical protein
MHDPRLATAFELLADIVGEMHASGRRPYAAAVKPRLLAKTNGGFDERMLGPGFRSFRGFIDAAADAGVVTVKPAPVGPDVEVLPIGAQSLGPRQQPSHGGRIRRDLWKAFLDWTPDQLRAYDRIRGRAIVIPATPAPLEPADYAAIREAFSDDDRYVPIAHITRDDQLTWMHTFVDQLPPSTPILSALEVTLGSEHPLRAFSNALRIDPAIRQAYTDYRLGEVIRRLDVWAAEHALDVDIYDVVPREGESDAQEQSATVGDTERLRHLIHAAVDRMPPEALDALHIPARFFLEQ